MIEKNAQFDGSIPGKHLVAGIAKAFLLLLIAGYTSAAAASAQGSGTTSSQALLRLEDGWASALVRRDTAMFRRHLAPDFVYTENGDVMGKKEVIEGVTGSDTVTWAGNEGMKVHLYGRTGVVTGILAMKGRGKEGAFSKRYRFTDTWMYLDGRWQIIAAQDYLLPK